MCVWAVTGNLDGREAMHFVTFTTTDSVYTSGESHKIKVQNACMKMERDSFDLVFFKYVREDDGEWKEALVYSCE